MIDFNYICFNCKKDIGYIEWFNCFGFCKPCQDDMVIAGCLRDMNEYHARVSRLWKRAWPQLGPSHALDNAL